MVTYLILSDHNIISINYKNKSNSDEFPYLSQTKVRTPAFLKLAAYLQTELIKYSPKFGAAATLDSQIQEDNQRSIACIDGGKIKKI